ncbi:hypothetical protein D3C73_616460 [compost metagenome]
MQPAAVARSRQFTDELRLVVRPCVQLDREALAPLSPSEGGANESERWNLVILLQQLSPLDAFILLERRKRLKMILKRHSWPPIRTEHLFDAVAQFLFGHISDVFAAKLRISCGESKMKIGLKRKLTSIEVSGARDWLGIGIILSSQLGEALLRVHPAGEIITCREITVRHKAAAEQHGSLAYLIDAGHR